MKYRLAIESVRESTDLFWRFDGSSVPVDDFVQRVVEERGLTDGSEQIVGFRQRFGGSFAALRIR